jgi:hypothetical protein
MLQVTSCKELSNKDVQSGLKAHTDSLGFLPGVRRPGNGADQPSSSSAGVKYG